MSICDITRLKIILHCTLEDKNRYHTRVRFKATNVIMDMDTPWLACEARHGVSISMNCQGIYREISRMSCDMSSQYPQYIMSKELKRVLSDNYQISIKNSIRVLVFDVYNSQIRCIQIDNPYYEWVSTFLWYFCQYHLSMLVDDIAHTFQCHIDLSMVSLRRGLC